MTQDPGLAVPFAWFEGWFVSLKIAQMAVPRSMTIMLASAPGSTSTTAAGCVTGNAPAHKVAYRAISSDVRCRSSKIH
jgi:hypothetical protein